MKPLIRHYGHVLEPDSPTRPWRCADFRLTATSPMGTKRNGIRKAFVPSINDAVEAFYAQVVQVLKPTPPRMPAEVAAEAIDAVQRAVNA